MLIKNITHIFVIKSKQIEIKSKENRYINPWTPAPGLLLYVISSSVSGLTRTVASRPHFGVSHTAKMTTKRP